MHSRISRARTTQVDRPAVSPRWEVWLLRAGLAASATFALVWGERGGAIAGLFALALTWAPALVASRGGVHLPRLLEGLWALTVAIPAASEAVGAYDRVTHWGKVVHGVEGGLAAGLAAFLLLGFADRARIDLPRQLAGLASVCVGVSAGVLWEFLEFLIDWVTSADLQKSNTDTMTDLLWGNLAAGVAALLALRVYHHALGEGGRAGLGVFSESLFTPLGRLLDRHGKMTFVLVLLLLAASMAGLWFAGRPLPGLPVD